mmetsp:Transcript_38410/g.76130  ORF Transcript_38410/g.76130 Transcript_38410/m.76130 type:complete len:122 (+) Transcript_38410:243-608(+)
MMVQHAQQQYKQKSSRYVQPPCSCMPYALRISCLMAANTRASTAQTIISTGLEDTTPMQKKIAKAIAKAIQNPKRPTYRTVSAQRIAGQQHAQRQISGSLKQLNNPNLQTLKDTPSSTASC